VEIVLRAAITFCFLWAITRGLGKRELAEMSPFELILLVTAGDLVQQGVTGEDFSLVGSFLAVGTIALLVLITSQVSFRWRRARQVLDGSPLVLLDHGEAHPRRMGWERVDMEDLREAARKHGIASLDDVRLAILEPDGKFSFITGDAGGDDEPGGGDGAEGGEREPSEPEDPADDDRRAG
jgi:uncharacterized membrane protein YcaP (DUF421 family)